MAAAFPLTCNRAHCTCCQLTPLLGCHPLLICCSFVCLFWIRYPACLDSHLLPSLRGFEDAWGACQFDFANWKGKECCCEIKEAIMSHLEARPSLSALLIWLQAASCRPQSESTHWALNNNSWSFPCSPAPSSSSSTAINSTKWLPNL